MDVEQNLAEAQEHATALEDAIEWCVFNHAIVKFERDAVYVKVHRPRLTIMHQAPTFLEAVEQVATGGKAI